MSGPVETEVRTPFRRREKLRLSLHLHRNIPPLSPSSPDKNQNDLSPLLHVRTISSEELGKNLLNSTKNLVIIDCRAFPTYSNCHISGAYRIPCSDRLTRKRVENYNGSVFDLVSTNNSSGRKGGAKSACGSISPSSLNDKLIRDVILYDDGCSDLVLQSTPWAHSSPTSVILDRLIKENKQPIYLSGGIQEFSKFFPQLCCDSHCTHSDLSPPNPLNSPNPINLNNSINSISNMESVVSPHIPPPLSFLPMLPLSPSALHAPNTSYLPPVNNSYENEPPTKVLDYLYVGSARDANDVELLRKLGISYILSVTTTVPMCGSGERELCDEFRTKLIPVSDNLCENLAPYFEEASDFIEEARKSKTSVLIHCHAGISRSPTIAIAYIMKHINLSTLDAYAFVQKYRRIISPNLNFMGQLVEYETKLKGYNSTDSSCSTSTCSISSEDGSISDDMESNLTSLTN